MIFYFSATGNSYHGASVLAKVIKDRLIDISKANKCQEYDYQLNDNESIGFFFPVYFYGIPTIVQEFVSKLQIDNKPSPYIFTVITCGGGIYGADSQFRKLLASVGHTIDIFFQLPTVDNYILLYDVPSTHVQKQKQAHANTQLQEIATSIKNKKRGGYSSGIIKKAITATVYPFYKRGRKTVKFYATESCVHCGLCKRICPSEAIEIKDGKPIWIKKQCAHCLGCIHRCPTKAIQYGSATKKRNRYVHPILTNKQ